MAAIKTRSTLLSALLLASGIPLLVFYVWPHSTALEEKVAEVRERHFMFASGASDSLQLYHHHVATTFDTVATLMLEGRDISFAGALLASQEVSHLCVIDIGSGRVLDEFKLADVALPEVIPPAMVERLVALAGSDAPAMAEVYQDRAGNPRFLIARQSGDRLVFASLRTDFIRDLADRIDFGEKGHAAVVDASGRVIAHPNADWVAKRRDLTGLSPVRHMLEGERGVETFISPALGAEVIAGFAAVPGPGWGVMVPQPMVELEAHATRIFRSAITVFAAGMVLSIVIALVVSKHVADLVSTVSRAAWRMACGEEGVRIKPARGLQIREFEVLRTSFNVMAERVEDARRSLRSLAERDALTGLLTKATFLDRAAARLAEPPEQEAHYAIFFLDVDNFKSINDIYGHALGDVVLKEIAECLEGLVGTRGLVCRQSGDEFLLLKVLSGGDTVRSFGAKVRDGTRRIRCGANRKLTFTCSIGAVGLAGPVHDLETLIGCADKAMYAAKQVGGDTVQVYDDNLRRERARRERLLSALKQDVAGQRLNTVYQPILSQATGQLCGFEALARWVAPDGESVPPSQFIALAEEGGLIFEFGRVVQRNAFAFAADLQAMGFDLPVAVNVSGLELARRDFADHFFSALEEAGVPPTRIVVEITETIFQDRAGLVSASLHELRKRGIRLCLDDFGKGFSSHGLLLSYSFDCLKIDMNFVGNVETDPKANAIVASLLELGRRMGLPMTLEGVESADAARFAAESGVERVQGFLYSRPLAAPDARAFAARHQARPRIVAAE